MSQARTVMEEYAARKQAMDSLAKMMEKCGVKAPGNAEAGTGNAAAGTGAAAAAGPGAEKRAAAESGKAGKKAEAPVIPEDQRRKPNRRENEFMLNLMILRNTLHANAPACRERARTAGKWVWRDIRLLTRLVEKVQDALLETMPKSRDEYYTAYAMGGHYELHMDGPLRGTRQLLITDRHLASISEAAMESECIMCMREGCEIGKCGLREALLEVAPPTEVEDGRWRKCEYRDAAGSLVMGKDVTV